MEVKLAAGKPFNDQHDASTVGTAPSGWLGRDDAGRYAEQLAATLQRGTPSAVGKESEVADANQAAGQNVKQEAAQELMSGNSVSVT